MREFGANAMPYKLLRVSIPTPDADFKGTFRTRCPKISVESADEAYRLSDLRAVLNQPAEQVSVAAMVSRFKQANALR
jgi:hypothetical protein